MQDRIAGQYLEQAIHASIESKNFKQTKELIQAIGAMANVNLACKDESGRHLLSHALACNADDELLQILFKLLKDEKVIFDADIEGRTLLWYAAKAGNVEFLKVAIEVTEDLWLKADNYNLSPLDIAIKFNRKKILIVLLNELQKSKQINEIINKTTLDGKTGLHFACEAAYFTTIALLLSYGASLDIADNKQITPFQLICDFETDELLAIYSLLPEKSISPDQQRKGKEKEIEIENEDEYLNKQIFLQRISDYLHQHGPSKTNVNNFYFQACGLMGLKTLILAKLEHGLNVNRVFYKAIKDSVEENANGITHTPNYYSSPLPFEILSELPHFNKRLNAEGKKPCSNTLIQKKLTTAFKQVNSDRNELSKLIADINLYLHTFQALSPHSKTNRKLLISLPLLISALLCLTCTVLIAVGAYYLKIADQMEDRDEHLKTHWKGFNLTLAGSLSLTLVGFSVIMGCNLVNHRWDKERIISKNSWDDIIDSLNSLLNNLENRREENFPTTPKTLENLGSAIRSLNASQTRSQAITTFQSIKTSLDELRSDINRNQIPIGFFHESQADLENQAWQEEAAKEPLLPHLNFLENF